MRVASWTSITGGSGVGFGARPSHPTSSIESYRECQVTPGRPPRVLVDATSVPADRGGVGRYVDGLLGALGLLDTDLAVVCQRTDAERYGRLLPSARIMSAPAAAAHRPARLAWEQTGLP